MSNALKTLIKEKDFLVCVDSDGCAINSMEIKHIMCFGPRMVDVWGLDYIKDDVIKVWNYVNLYSLDRGINRFKALIKVFDLLQKKFIFLMTDYLALKEWVENTNVLSNPALEAEYKKSKEESLKKALTWSYAVNESIALLDNEQPSFSHVQESLKLASEKADIVVVSSANAEAIDAEWHHQGIAEYVKVMAGQEMGTKTECIRIAKKDRYDNEHVLMIGDAPGDYEAAKNNNVLYYPIIPGRESESWKRFYDEAFYKFINKEYAGIYQNELIKEFMMSLKSKDS